MVKTFDFEAVGAVHLHSKVSDGTLSIPEIAEIAGTKNLDFLLFSDHNTLAPKREGLEGWYGGVLALIGYEINDADDKNHYLAFRLDQEVGGRMAADYVPAVKAAGGMGFIAHPAEKRQYFEAYPPYPWTDWSVQGFDGIEIWNQLSEWMEGLTWKSALWRIWHPLKSIRFPVQEILDRWDVLNRERRVVGIGGIDVHAFAIKLLGCITVEIYPYKVQFKSIRTHVMTETPLTPALGFHPSETAVYNAILAGRCFVSNFSLGDARGFRFSGRSDRGLLPMGSRLPFLGPVDFDVQAPLSGQIRLLRDGQTIAEEKGSTLTHTVDAPGVYRVEMYRQRRGWIYTNPIVLTD